jgi:copper chaperone
MLRLRVEGMTCQGCVNAIRQAVAGVAPGQAVTVTLATGEVQVVAGKASAAAIAGAIERAGFVVAEHPAA